LFTSFITYLIPTCFIALVPCLVISFENGYFFIGIFDIVVLCSIVLIALNKKLSLLFRKLFVVSTLYSLAVILLVNLSLTGPGTIYLLAVSVLATVFLPKQYAYASVVVNLLICCGCAFVIEFDFFHSPLAKDYPLGVWVAISSNLIFLSWMLVLLISNAIEGLKQTIIKEFQLRKELQIEVAEKAQYGKELKESETQYKSLFFLNPAPMWVLDIETLKLLQVNDAAIKSYGYTKEEFLSLTIMDIKMEEDRDELQKDIETAIATDAPLTVITQHRRKNKEQFHVEVILNAILFKGKEATLVIARDISQQVDYVKTIQDKNDKLREIAFIQSHLVRAPLAKILGLVDLITIGIDEKADPELLHCLDQSAKELDEIIRSISKKTESIM